MNLRSLLWCPQEIKNHALFWLMLKCPMLLVCSGWSSQSAISFIPSVVCLPAGLIVSEAYNNEQPGRLLTSEKEQVNWCTKMSFEVNGKALGKNQTASDSDQGRQSLPPALTEGLQTWADSGWHSNYRVLHVQHSKHGCVGSVHYTQANWSEWKYCPFTYCCHIVSGHGWFNLDCYWANS